jgi:cytochrome c oxidase subunit 4
MDQGAILVGSLLFGGAIVMLLFILGALASSAPVEEGAARPMRLTAEPERAGAHPGELEYIRVAVVLAVVTAFEVALYYVVDDIGNAATSVLLLVSSAAKFLLVALYFMHLKFDSRLFTTLFLFGIITAFAVYFIALLTLEIFV